MNDKSLERIAHALEVIAGTGTANPPENWEKASCYIWQATQRGLKAVEKATALPLDILVGLEPHIATLRENTQQFAQGYPANNALLWGARGMGKSTLVKSVHADCNDGNLYLIEIYREDIATLPLLLDVLRNESEKRFILFCDDLSFDEQDGSYKSLKAVLEGGIAGRPENVIFYATSNRRHLIPRQMIENERSTAINPSEGTEEKVSLSDRFGLWLGFYPAAQEDYLEMLRNYAEHYGLQLNEGDALEWAKTRGSRSGRVAWQYIQDIAGRQKVKI